MSLCSGVGWVSSPPKTNLYLTPLLSRTAKLKVMHKYLTWKIIAYMAWGKKNRIFSNLELRLKHFGYFLFYIFSRLDSISWSFCLYKLVDFRLEMLRDRESLLDHILHHSEFTWLFLQYLWFFSHCFSKEASISCLRKASHILVALSSPRLMLPLSVGTLTLSYILCWQIVLHLISKTWADLWGRDIVASPWSLFLGFIPFPFSG